MMTLTPTQTPNPAFRLAARLRVLALAAAIVGAAAPAARAATLTYSFELFSTDFAKFDTTTGTLLGVDITFDGVLGATNPFSPFGASTCSAVLNGGMVTISAPGTPTLLTVVGGGSAGSFSCQQFEIGVAAHGATSVAPSFFGAFSSAGITPITLSVIPVGGTATFVRDGGPTLTVDAYWQPRLSSGTVRYTYCPVGQNCDPPPTTPPAVPEPATATMLAMGLAGLVARARSGRRARRRSA